VISANIENERTVVYGLYTVGVVWVLGGGIKDRGIIQGFSEAAGEEVVGKTWTVQKV